MIILVGASASGKTEVAKCLAKKYGITKVVTTTTRNPRINEVNGKDYFFVDQDTFKRMIKEGKFVEYTFFNGNYYGSTKDQVADNKCIVIDPVGLENYLKLNNKNILTFYLDADEDIRFKRMIERGDELEKAKSRIKHDHDIFPKKPTIPVDYIIDSGINNSVEIVTDQIFNIYNEKVK